MTTKRPEFLPFLLAALTLLVVGALLLAHVDVPEALYGLLAAAGAAFLALVHPGPHTTPPVSSSIDTTEPAAPPAAPSGP